MNAYEVRIRRLEEAFTELDRRLAEQERLARQDAQRLGGIRLGLGVLWWVTALGVMAYGLA